MLNRLILTGALLAASFPALADSWDSNKNIDRAMNAAVATYRSAGVAGLVDGANNCYAGLNASPRNRQAGRDAEYCFAFAVSSAVIDRETSRATGRAQHEYFTNGELLIRAMYVLEQAQVVTRPEEFQPYMAPRVTRISTEIPRRL